MNWIPFGWAVLGIVLIVVTARIMVTLGRNEERRRRRRRDGDLKLWEDGDYDA